VVIGTLGNCTFSFDHQIDVSHLMSVIHSVSFYVVREEVQTKLKKIIEGP
jgi:hypothetical protein